MGMLMWGLALVAVVVAVAALGYVLIAMTFALGETLSRDLHGEPHLTTWEILTFSYMED